MMSEGWKVFFLFKKPAETEVITDEGALWLCKPSAGSGRKEED